MAKKGQFNLKYARAQVYFNFYYSSYELQHVFDSKSDKKVKIRIHFEM